MRSKRNGKRKKRKLPEQAKLKEELDQLRTELERAQRRGELGESERNSIRKNSRAGKEARRKQAAQSAKSAYPKKTSARGSNGGRHRAGCFELDGNSRIAFAGRRTREVGATGRAFASTRRRAGCRDQSSRERCASCPRRIARSEPANRLIYFSRSDRRRKN